MRKLIIALLLPIAGPALAHTGAGHVDSFAAGFGHPFLGVDHLLAMVFVGVWASLIGGTRQWVWPLAFLGALVAGGAAGYAGHAMPGLELVIAGSVMLLGFVVAARLALPVAFGAVLITLLSFAHGVAHGAEAAGAGFVPYAAGFLLASAALHGAGLLFARSLTATIVRIAGGAAMLAGLALVLA